MAKETSNIEMLKRQNYFDLKRDEFMALEEYLRSPISEQDLRKKADGGIMDINQMITPVGYKMGTREGNLVGDKEKMMKAGILDDADDLRTMTKRYVLLKSLAESYGGKDVLQRMDDIKKMSPVEIEIEYQKLIGLEES